jgi:uncharacterized protein (TIGR00661 family)
MKTVLVAVLDWGLGHATRSIAVVQELIAQQATVLLAGNGQSLLLLKEAFPNLRTFELPAYAVKYPSKGSFIGAIFKQMPHLINIIQQEHTMIQAIVQQEKVSAIIADNRYGCFSETVPSIIICHQLNLQLPRGMQWLSRAINAVHHKYLNRFAEIWIPDEPAEHLSLSGKLSQTNLTKAKHIGVLSRLKHNHYEPTQFMFDVVAVLSGPEPQRSILENLIRKQLQKLTFKTLIVRGLPHTDGVLSLNQALPDAGHITHVNHLPMDELQRLLQQASVIIARSGYSTIMDLARLGKLGHNIILIPTPGQTEQEYLADRLMAKGWCQAQRQQTLNLSKALPAIEQTKGLPHKPGLLLPTAIQNLLC